jgi:hypothetical protein
VFILVCLFLAAFVIKEAMAQSRAWAWATETRNQGRAVRVDIAPFYSLLSSISSAVSTLRLDSTPHFLLPPSWLPRRLINECVVPFLRLLQ